MALLSCDDWSKAFLLFLKCEFRNNNGRIKKGGRDEENMGIGMSGGGGTMGVLG